MQVLPSITGPAQITAIGNTIFFSGYDLTNGHALWKSDGTSAGRLLVKDTHESSFGYAPNSLTSRKYFSKVMILNGRALWKSDGSSPCNGKRF